jgi:WD40 repeat protein
MQGGGDRRRPRNQQTMEDFVPKKKSRGQRPVDYFSSAIHYLKARPYAAPGLQHLAAHVPPHDYYCKDLVPPAMTPFNPSTALCTQWAHTAHYPDNNRSAMGRPRRVYFTTMRWSPTGRKLLCATSNGEFVVFNGHAFGVEMKTAAHEDGKPCKALAWGRRTDAVLSGDEGGTVKLWGNNLTLAAEFDSNQRAVRDIAWSPGDHKFCTAGQDGSVRIWDAERIANTSDGSDFESKLEGHGGDVLSVQWHPNKALVATSSQDRCVRLWDPRKGADAQLAVLESHTEPVSAVTWHPNGRDWQLLSASRDATVKLWDARMMAEVCRFVGHSADVTGVDWHPTHPDLFASCGMDGTIGYWSTATNATEVTRFAASVESAHDQVRDKPNGIACVRWSPVGHMLASCASEVNFWTRNKPGAVEEIRYENEEVSDVVMPTAVTAGAAGAW